MNVRTALVNERGALRLHTFEMAPHPATLKSRAGLERIMARILEGVDELADGVNAGALTPTQWQQEMVNLLAVGHAAAWMEGAGTNQVGPLGRREIARLLGEQADYLNRFADLIEQTGWSDFDARYRARAALYVGALKATESRARTLGLPLPYHPADGSTECLVNCRCRWEIRKVGDNDDYDCVWRMGAAEHCDTCRSRAARHSARTPLRIRGGEVVR